MIVKNKKVLRMVNHRGSIKFLFCEEDEDGYVERVYLNDEVELSAKDVQGLKSILAEVIEASKKSVTILNAANRKDLVVVDLGE